MNIVVRTISLCFCIVLTGAQLSFCAETTIINIEGLGAGAKFNSELPTSDGITTVTPGQKVRWVNKDNTNTHSARSIRTKLDGKHLFDTGFIKPNESKEIVFDDTVFSAVGMPSTNELDLDYESEVFPEVTSKIRLKAATAMPPSTTTHVIESLSEGPNQIFRPSQIAVKSGDEIVWRNAANANPGLHAVEFTNWSRDKQYVQILNSDVGFDQQAGKNQNSSATPGAVFVKVKILSEPPAGQNIDFLCWVHGQAMSGTLSFGVTAPAPTAPAGPAVLTPEYKVKAGLIAAFDAVKIDDKKADSYFALSADINGDGLKDLVTSGLGQPGISLAEVAWYENPSWKKHIIGHFDVPVALDAADVDEDGHIDLAICYDYGLCIMQCKPENGTIAWLKNPGDVQPDSDWTRYQIGKLMATHRLRFGHFTQGNTLELLAVPVVGGAAGNIHDPIKTMVFKKPTDPMTAANWTSTLADGSLRVIHEISTHQFLTSGNTKLDSTLTASEEGISWLRFGKNKKWENINIGKGELEQVDKSPEHWKGSGAVDIGAHNGDPFAFIASTEPFHGNILALYTKNVGGSLDQITWKRKILDVLGPLSNRGEGTGHDVVMADIDGDGNDECLVGMRGPMPYSGVLIYKVKNLANGSFIRQQISPISAAQVVVDDFNNDGRPDFITIPYRVLTYYESEDTEVMLYLNKTPKLPSSSN